MCCGFDTRVWPESRERLPKQFIPLSWLQRSRRAASVETGRRRKVTIVSGSPLRTPRLFYKTPFKRDDGLFSSDVQNVQEGSRYFASN
jgi:hypothetical protein